MKMEELEMHCGECPVIEHCNNYADTPPCSQPRFEGVDVDKFKVLAETSKYGNIYKRLDDIFKRLQIVLPRKHEEFEGQSDFD